MVVEQVPGEEDIPVCSPQFLDRVPRLTLKCIGEMPLLRHSRAIRNLWLEKARLPIVYPRDVIALDDVALTIGGAPADHGIAMARSLLVRDYLQSGRLVRPFDLTVPGIFKWGDWVQVPANETCPLGDRMSHTLRLARIG